MYTVIQKGGGAEKYKLSGSYGPTTTGGSRTVYGGGGGGQYQGGRQEVSK